MKQAVIVGAGLSGLIAANLLKSRGYDFQVYEEQATLPDNHKAVLRFRSPVLGEALGIPFKKVQALLCLSQTEPDFTNGPLRNSLAYSYATTGVRRTDRSITRLLAGPIVADRWVAPEDFREALLDRIHNYVTFSHEHSLGPERFDVPVIMTIPMKRTYAMVNDIEALSDSVTPKFQAIKYLVLSAQTLNTDAYGTMYNSRPEPAVPWTRLSITGPRVALEVSMMWADNEKFPNHSEFFEWVLREYLGLEIDFTKGAPKVHYSSTDRILPIPERVRKNFIMHLTDRYNVYSLGRFATWRPGMLLDDLIQDTNIVATMIEGDKQPRYEATK